MPNLDETIAYYGGRLVPARDVAIPFWDLALTAGASVAEQLRTYGGQVKFLDRHWARFSVGLSALGIDLYADNEIPRRVPTDVANAIEALIAHNLKCYPDGSELGICLFASPGASVARAPQFVIANPDRATFLIHSYRLPTETWVDEIRQGISLCTASWRDIPSSCLPKHFKHRSRLNYYLAEREAESMRAAHGRCC